MRTSEILRAILTRNPGVESFSVARILASIGSDRYEASLVVFAIPVILPVPGPSDLGAMPASVLGSQMAFGQTRITLPRVILEKTVSRRSLAVAIHALLPVIEAVEKLMRPRWRWLSRPLSRRLLGILVFVLALALAYPLFGFNALHALSIFVIALGLAEQDGLAILVGVVAGLMSLAVVASSAASAVAMRAHLGKRVRKLLKKLSLGACSDFLDKRGYGEVSSLMNFQWAQLMLLWEPEQPGVQTQRPASEDPELLDADLADIPSRAMSLAPWTPWSPGRLASLPN